MVQSAVKSGSIIFSTPWEETFRTWNGNFVDPSHFDWQGSNGFLVCPFQNLPESGMKILRVENESEGIPDETRMSHILREIFAGSREKYGSIQKAEYLEKIRQARLQISEGNVEKLVLSRPIVLDYSVIDHIGEVLNRLRAEFPAAFVYALISEWTGVWVGASPELLVSARGRDYETIALAGTRKAGFSGAGWGPKEQREQSYVLEFLEMELDRLGVRGLEIDPSETRQAGPVEHLANKLRFQFELGANGVLKLAHALHPTPAVCGTPRQPALEWILANEGYSRGLYSGFLGPIRPEQADLFVNIRCMNLTGDCTSLFVGGGITFDSEPESEWEETHLKARTLLGVIEKIRTFAKNS